MYTEATEAGNGSSWLSWRHHFESFTVTTMTWLTAMEYRCHKWPRICSTCRKHFPVTWMGVYLDCDMPTSLTKFGEWTHMLTKGRQLLFLMSSTIFLMVKSGKSIVSITDNTFTGLDHEKNGGWHKKQELPTLREHMSSLPNVFKGVITTVCDGFFNKQLKCICKMMLHGLVYI
jgi:hypothetical protein